MFELDLVYHASAAGGGSDHGNSSNTGGSVNETPTYTSPNRESGRNPLAKRFLHWRIDDGRAGARHYDDNRNSPDVELQRVVNSPQTGNRPTAQPPVPLSVAENLVRTHASGPQDIAYERLLSKDSQALQHESPVRKSDDVPSNVPGFPRKRQHLRDKRGEKAISTETHREPSVGSVLDGGSLEVDDDLRQPSLQSRQFRKENSPGDVTLLACPYHKQASVTNKHRCKAAAYQTIHRLKEHLYRRHRQPPHCLRCGETFPRDEDVEAHLRRPEGICDLVSGVFVEGLTGKQIQKLKSKKRKQGVTTDEDKWQDIYEIVFPNAKNRPDPYYCQTDADSICRRIWSELKKHISTMLEPVFGPLEGAKRRKVLDTFERFFAERMHQSSFHAAPRKTVVPESEGNNTGAQVSPAQDRPKCQGPHQPTVSTTRIVEHGQSDALQEAVEYNLFNLPNGAIVDLDFDFLKDLEGHSPSGPASWATDCFNI